MELELTDIIITTKKLLVGKWQAYIKKYTDSRQLSFYSSRIRLKSIVLKNKKKVKRKNTYKRLVEIRQFSFFNKNQKQRI